MARAGSPRERTAAATTAAAAKGVVPPVGFRRRAPGRKTQSAGLRGAYGGFVALRAAMSIGLILQQNAAAHPTRPFIRFEGHATSYDDANAQVNRYADVLRTRGVQRGDVVAILGKNTPESLLIFLKSDSFGLREDPISPRSPGCLYKEKD